MTKPIQSPAGAQHGRPRVQGLRVAVVAAVAAAALAAQLVPALGDLFEYHRSAIAEGQVWRLATGHLAHASWDQLGLDLAVVLALGLAAPARAVLRALAASTFAIPAAVWLLQPELTSYRGLSGLGAALVALLAADVLRDHLRGGGGNPRRTGRGLALAAGATLVGLAGKTAWELWTGTGLFLDTAAAGYVPVPLAHAVGGVCGVVVVLGKLRSR